MNQPAEPSESVHFDARHYSFREIWHHLWPLMRPFRLSMLLSGILVSIVGLAVAIMPLYPKVIIDTAIPRRDIQLILIVSAVFLACQFLRMLLWYWGMGRILWIKESILFTLRSNSFQHLQNLCLCFHNKYPSGFLYEQVFGRSINSIGMLLISIFNQMIVYLASMVFSLAFCLSLSPPMTLLIIIGAIGYVVTARKLSPTIHALTKESINRSNAVAQYIMDKLRGTKTIQAFALEEQVMDAFQERIWKLQKASYQTDRQVQKLGFVTEGLGYLINVVIMVAGAYAILGARISVGTLVAFVGYEGTLIGLISATVNMYGQFSAARAGFDQVLTVLDTQSTVIDKPGTVMPKAVLGQLEFRNVTFNYDGNPVLRGINLVIPAGQTVALVGRSGAGKTTIANLLLRFYDPNAGAILLDGRDIRDLPLREYRSLYSVVLQDPYLFDESIANNLRCARPDATDDDIREALRKAQALEFVKAFPDGIHH
ncbi:MAG: ABC transporter ATP-binding protein, partial [Fibrobacterota bacterium]